MSDDGEWVAAAPSFANGLQLKERGTWDEPRPVDAGQEADESLVQDEPGSFTGTDDLSGDVDEQPRPSVGPGGDRHHPTGSKQPATSAEDFGEAVDEAGVRLVGKVRRIPGVPVVGFGDGPVAGGVHLAMHGRPVGRAGQHERDSQVSVP